MSGNIIFYCSFFNHNFALHFAYSRATRTAHRNYNARLEEGLSQPTAINNTALELTKAAELHGRVFVASSFYEEVVQGKNRDQRSPEFQKVLENLLELHLLQTFFRHLGDILRVSILNKKKSLI